MSLTRTKYISDFSEENLKTVIDKYINGAHYPQYSVELSQISRTSQKYTGDSGQLVSVTPFFLKFVSPSFVPRSIDCILAEERFEANFSAENFYTYSVDNTILPDANLALHSLIENMAGGYVLPLFHSERDIALMKKSRIISPWRYEEQAVYFEKLKEERGNLSKLPLLNACAVLIPHPGTEEPEGKTAYSYNSNGEVFFHGSLEKVEHEHFCKLSSFVENILSLQYHEYSFAEFADEIIELLPELFDMKWSSKKMKQIAEAVIFDFIEENSVPSNMSFNSLLESLNPFEKIYLSEKILYKYFGIAQYFRITYKK